MAGLLDYLAGGTAAAGGSAGGFTAAGGTGGASSVLGSGAFGGAEGAAGAAGTFGAPSLASQLLTGAGSFGHGLAQFGMDTLNPAQGAAGQRVNAAFGAHQAPGFGDLAQYIIQQLVNGELQKSTGPLFKPLSNAVGNAAPSYLRPQSQPSPRPM
jgi:hypothetical protein